MSEIVTEDIVEDEAVLEEPTATDVPEATPEVEAEEPEVDEEVEPDLELEEPTPVAVDLHPGRLAPALVGPSHHDLNPAFAPR